MVVFDSILTHRQSLFTSLLYIVNIVEFLIIRSNKDGSLEPGAFIAASLFRCCLVLTPSFCMSFYKYISNQKLEEKGRKLDSRRFGYSRSRCSLYCRGGHYAFGNLEMAALCSTSFVFV